MGEKAVKFIIGGDTASGEAAMERFRKSGTVAAEDVARAYASLGIRAAESFEAQRKSATAAFDKIKASGVATNDELVRAQAAHAKRMAQIDEEQHGKRVSLLETFKSNWLGITAAVAAAGVVISKGLDWAEQGAKAEAQGQAFANLAASYGQSADQIVASLKRASGETLSMQQAIEQAGKAMVLGVSGEYLPKLMEMAKASARITGESTQKAFNDLIEGVAKGSSELLNNLGIIVRAEDAYKKFADAHNIAADALSAEQKQQAILNEVMIKGNDIVERAGKLGESDIERINKMKASLDDLGTSFAKLMAKPVGATASFLSQSFAGWDQLLFGQQSLDAGVSEEGMAAARRKQEETEKAAAIAQNNALLAAMEKAEEAKKVERAKQLVEFTKHNVKLVEVEKKRIAEMEQLETAHLTKMTSGYADAVKRYETLVDTMGSTRAKFGEARSLVDPVAGQGDLVNKRLADLDALKAKEEQIGNSWSMSADDKAKAYADLALASAAYKDAVVVDGAEIISQLDAEATARTTIERLQSKSAELLASEEQNRAAAAENFAAQMFEAQAKVTAFGDSIKALDDLLTRMNNKEVNIIFKAQNVGQLAAAGGISGLPPNDINSPILGSNHAGTAYVAKEGLYQLARGESVNSRGETQRATQQAAPVTLAPVFQISGVSSSGAEKTGRELAREIVPEIQRLLRLAGG